MGGPVCCRLLAPFARWGTMLNLYARFCWCDKEADSRVFEALPAMTLRLH